MEAVDVSTEFTLRFQLGSNVGCNLVPQNAQKSSSKEPVFDDYFSSRRSLLNMVDVLQSFFFLLGLKLRSCDLSYGSDNFDALLFHDFTLGGVEWSLIVFLNHLGLLV